MKDKLKTFLQSLFARMPLAKGNASYAMSMAVAYTLLSFLCILLYIIMTVSDWYVTGRGDKGELRLFITMLLSAGAAGGILSIGKMLIDKNKNGIPDVMEEEKKDTPAKGDTHDLRHTQTRSTRRL